MHSFSHTPPQRIEGTYPNPPFITWMRSQTNLISVQILAIISFVGLLSSSIYYASHLAEVASVAAQENPSAALMHVQHIVNLANLVVVSGFIIYMISITKDNEAGKYRSYLVFQKVFSKKQDKEQFENWTTKYDSVIESFKSFFLWFWIFILLYYFIALIKPPYETGKAEYIIFTWLEYTFNALNLLCIFGCFVVMSQPERESQGNRHLLNKVGLFSFILLLALFIGFSLMDGTSYDSDSNQYSNLILYFNAIIGILSAIVTALLVGRLDSKLVGLPSGLISILYVYPAIQPLVVIFHLHAGLNELIKTGTLILAFLFKMLFFFVIIYALQSGRIRNYMVNSPTLSKRVSNIYSKSKEQTIAEIIRWTCSWRCFLPMLTLLLCGIASLLFINYKEHINPIASIPNIDLFTLIIELAHIACIPLFLFYLDRSLSWKHSRQLNLRIHHSVFRAPEDWDLKGERQKSTEYFLKRFKINFGLFWIVLLAFYFVMFASDSTNDSNLAYETLDGGSLIRFCLFPFLKYSLNTLSIYFLFLCFCTMYIPQLDEKSKHTILKFRQIGAFVITLLIIAFPTLIFFNSYSGTPYSINQVRNYFTVFDALSGVVNAVVMTLFIGRLESRIIGMPTRLFALLYLYPALQPLFLAFEQGGSEFVVMKAIILSAVFILKIVFFYIVLFVLETERLGNYLYSFPTLNSRVDSIYQNHFDINIVRTHDDLFKFRITHGAHEAYHSLLQFSSRVLCEAALLQLRKQIEEGHQFDEPKEIGGTYNIVLSIESLEYCFSKDLNSKKEAEEFVIESREKLPYCRITHT